MEDTRFMPIFGENLIKPKLYLVSHLLTTI